MSFCSSPGSAILSEEGVRPYTLPWKPVEPRIQTRARRPKLSIVVRYAPVPSSTIEQYDEVMRRLQESGEMPADGFDYHVAFLSDGQLLVSEVWDSQEQLEAFGERIMPLLADVALEHSGQPEIFEVHNIIRR